MALTVNELGDLLEDAETYRTILGAYNGGFSMGVGTDENDPTQLYIQLHVEGEPKGFPERITLKGYAIPIVVQGGFEAPRT